MQMKSKGGASLPVYDFKTHRRRAEEWVSSRPFILVEGFWSLRIQRFENALDLRIFIDTPESIRLQRRIQRDTVSRGRTEAEVTTRFWDTVAPMHDAHVAPTMADAHLVVDGTAPVTESVSLVTRFIQGLVLDSRL